MDKLEKALITLEKKSVQEDTRTITFIGSTPTVDRDRDIIPIDQWKLENYKSNPVFLWAHNYSELPLGKTLDVYVEDNKLMFKVQFATKEENPKAENVYLLYKGGYLNATSVGFRGNWNYDVNTDIGIYNDVELYELSAVPVPANPEALVYMRSIGVKGISDIAKECDLYSSKCNTKDTNTKEDNKEPANNNPATKEDTKSIDEVILEDIKSLKESIDDIKSTINNMVDKKEPKPESKEDKGIESELIQLIDKYKSVNSPKDNIDNDLKSLIDKFKTNK